MSRYNPIASLLNGGHFAIEYTNPSGTLTIAAGTPVNFGGTRIGVAVADIPPSSVGELAVGETVWTVQKDASTFALGDPVYYYTAGAVVTSTSGAGYTLMGYATAAAATGLATVPVRLLDSGASLTATSSGIANAIADPGASGAIPTTLSGNVQIVTAGAETRTIAAPASVGIDLLLIMKTHGGTATITVASTINSTGNNTIALTAAGQAIELVGIISGTTLEWAVKFNDGATLSTV